jgi:hypothetical protein
MSAAAIGKSGCGNHTVFRPALAEDWSAVGDLPARAGIEELLNSSQVTAMPIDGLEHPL